ncbi:MAG TPA: NAD-dependent succinate-semialdehyde dehydrogenase [Methylomirabilota bacterium]|jgi:succinate-semialdehyde dehydrogenase/glutarate-semialdehyde dehydrogenase
MRRAAPPAMASVNPATGETLRMFDTLTAHQVGQRLERAVTAFRAYRRTSSADRARSMQRAADILETKRDQYARLMTVEMGKPIGAALEEVLKCARGCRYYAEHAAAMLADEAVATPPTRSVVRFQPLGAVLGVMPWNFPFWQVFRFATPALMAGNVVLLKHASNVPQCAVAIEDVFAAAGFAPGVFQTLLIPSARVNELLDDDRVVAASVTGSEAAGSAVAGRAGSRIKPTVLELGGSDPFIVMPSADVAEAARTAVTARIINNGQSCIAAKRFIVHADVYDDFTGRFVEGMRSLRVGDPLNPETQLGPLATFEQRDILDAQVRKSVRAGARLLTGGHALDGAGAYYAPTVLVDIPRDSPAAREELFGPVALLFRAPDADAAIRLANDTRFGLGASVWTNDAAERDRFVDEIESGMVFVNALVASDPRLPFGGIKKSGYGRELSVYGLRAFVNVKTVSIRDRGEGEPGRATE